MTSLAVHNLFEVVLLAAASSTWMGVTRRILNMLNFESIWNFALLSASIEKYIFSSNSFAVRVIEEVAVADTNLLFL